MPSGVPQALLEVSPEDKFTSENEDATQNVNSIPNIESPNQPVLDAGVAYIVRPELEGIAAARDAA